MIDVILKESFVFALSGERKAMGLSDRDYMKIDYRKRVAARRPSLLQRLKFAIWRFFRRGT